MSGMAWVNLVLHSVLFHTGSVTCRRMELEGPPKDSVPHPTTVASFPMKVSWRLGKQMGLMCSVKRTRRLSLSRAMSFW
uniref:Putative secreted protein n=1 Tax=Ixodes ricinus TaxID=34613 RepID=A0A6B0U410_IXORI